MLLAEALALRADRQKILKELTGRIEDNARVPHGAAPDEDPNALLERASEVAGELTDLVQRINRTNSNTMVDSGTGDTISDLIARRDQAQRMTDLCRAVAKAGTRGAGRGFWSRDADGPMRAVVDVSRLQQTADEWGVRYREIDVRLQQLNWSTELRD
jgi:hypothetical protein